MTEYMYLVKYEVQTSVFDEYVYEDYLFTTFEDAHANMLAIVQEEERYPEDKDFYQYHVIITKKAFDVDNPWDYDEDFWFYDMQGRQIYQQSKNQIKKSDDVAQSNLKKFCRGDIIHIKPFPWNNYTGLPFEVYGVISSYSKDKKEYIIYAFDKVDNRFFHSHESAKAMVKIKDILNIDTNIKMLSKILKKEISVEDEDFEDKLCDGKILATTKDRLIDVLGGKFNF